MLNLDEENLIIEDTNLSLEDIILGMHYGGEDFKPFDMYLNLAFNNGLKINNVIKTKLPFNLFEDIFLDLKNGKIPRKEFNVFGCNSEEDFMLILMCLPVVEDSKIFEGRELNILESEMFLENSALRLKSVDIVCLQDVKKIEYKKCY